VTIIHHRTAGKADDESQTFNLLQLYKKRERPFFRTPITPESLEVYINALQSRGM